MLQVHIKPVTPFMQNCHLLICDETKSAVLVDAGGDEDLIMQWLEEFDCRLEGLWFTHGHLDHIGGAEELSRLLNVPVIGPHKADDFWVDSLKEQGQMFGIPAPKVPQISKWLEEGDELTLGNLKFKVLHCPGHTPGSVSFYEPTSQSIFVGDVLFVNSIGRTDFPQGNAEQLLDSIRSKLFSLDGDTRFYPGHGPSGTLAREKQNNPYVRA